MRKALVIAGVVALGLATPAMAKADTLSDWLLSLFGYSIGNSGTGGSHITPDDGPGSGTGVAD